MNTQKKICDNAKTIRMSAVIVLAVLFVYRIFEAFDDESYIYFCLNGDRLLVFLAVTIFYFLNALEAAAVFLKGKVSLAISIVCINAIIPVIMIEVILTFISLFAILVEGYSKGTIGIIVEFTSNIIFCATAGILFILESELMRQRINKESITKLQ